MSMHAVAHGSSFNAAGLGCGETGKTMVQHQQTYAHTHTHTKLSIQTGYLFKHFRTKQIAVRLSF